MEELATVTATFVTSKPSSAETTAVPTTASIATETKTTETTTVKVLALTSQVDPLQFVADDGEADVDSVAGDDLLDVDPSLQRAVVEQPDVGNVVDALGPDEAGAAGPNGVLSTLEAVHSGSLSAGEVAAVACGTTVGISLAVLGVAATYVRKHHINIIEKMKIIIF